VSQSDLYPPIDPLQKGFLDVGEGHSLYWEVSGNPNGRPILFLHGGPGASVQPIFRRFFDPQIWKIVLFDQRGCGKSRPAASIIDNTTDHLIADIERLRIHLEIQAWSLFGGSWGSTLALAYGQAFPERVLGFTLRGIFLFRPSEVDWFLHGMGRFFPEAQAKFKTYLPVSERGDVLEAYSRRLNHSDSMVHLPAAHAWYAYPCPGSSVII
jgi:proline iminopeptidase